MSQGVIGTTEKFISDSRLIHGDRYDYSRVNYVRSDKKVEIVCRVHGSFLKTPIGHLRGCGCNECGPREEKATKVCDRCNLEKPIELFSRKGNYHRNTCKECVRGHITSKVCNRCHVEKNVSEFGKNRDSKDGYRYYCNECRRAEGRAKTAGIRARRRDEMRNMTSKICGGCHIEKKIDEFPLCHGGRTGRRIRICLDCKRERDNEYSRQRNVRDREKVNARNAKWAAENREQVLANSQRYNQINKEKLKKQAKECRLKKIGQYREVARNRAARRRASDLNFKLKDVLRKRVKNALHGLGKADRTMNLLGCSVEELRVHLEKQFSEGMNWGNYGLHGWHIDHRIPCCSFNMTKEEEQRKCFHYTNLRPLWAKENWAKGVQDRQQKVA